MTITLLGRAGDTFEASLAAQDLDPAAVDARWQGIGALERELFETAVCVDGSVDAVLVPADWLPRLAARGALRPLDDLLAGAPPEGWPAAWSDAFVDVVTFAADAAPSRAERAAVWGLPFHDGPPLLVYRTDLFDDPAERRAYRERFGTELAPAATWSDFDRQARFFTRPEEGLFGTVLAGAPDGHNDVYDFVTQVRVRGGDVVARDGSGILRPAFGGAAGLGALAWLRGHAVDDPTVPPDARTLDSVGSGRAFAEGRVALMMNWAGYAHAAQGPGSRVAGRVGTALAPTADDGTPTPVVNAFWALAVTAGSRRVDEAWSVIRECLSPRGDRATTRAGSSGTRLDTWRDAELLARTPAFALFEEAHRVSRPLPQIAALPLLVDALNHLVDDVVNGGQDAGPALERAVRRVETVLAADD